jgi:hypothetical protein
MANEPERIGIGLENEAANFLGIVTFHVVPQAGIDETDILTVEARGRSVRPIAKSGFTPAEPTKFSFHTCFFPEGEQTIKFSLRSRAGALLEETERTVIFAKPNDLSENIRRFFESHEVPWGFFGLTDYGKYRAERLDSASSLRPWFDRPDAGAHIEVLQKEKRINDDEAELLRRFVEDGIIILDNLIDGGTVDAANNAIDLAIEEKVQNYKYGSSQRIEHLHAKYPGIRKLWLDPRHRRIVEILFDRRARPAQTLTYVFGSQQESHQDTIHLTPFPPGYMCGTWIALQDVQPDSGELVYYPGSHREPRVYMHEVKAKKTVTDWSDFQAKVPPIWREIASRYHQIVYRPRKGTVAIWHENLLHGGSVRKDASLERRSIVIHCFADGCVSLADSSGITSTAASLAEVDAAS